MTDFRYRDRVLLTGVDPTMSPELQSRLGTTGLVEGGLDAKGRLCVLFGGYGLPWGGSMVPTALLENLTLKDDPERRRSVPVGKAGLPGFEEMLALQKMGGLRFKSVPPRDGRWGRSSWKGRGDFHETARFEVRLGDRTLGEVWRATGVSYMSSRNVWLADTAMGANLLATDIHGAEDLRTTRILAGLNVAGVALFTQEIGGMRVAPVAVILGNFFEGGCWLVERPDGKAHRLWLHWEPEGGELTKDPGYRASTSVWTAKGWVHESFRDPESCERALEAAIAAIRGDEPAPDAPAP